MGLGAVNGGAGVGGANLCNPAAPGPVGKCLYGTAKFGIFFLRTLLRGRVMRGRKGLPAEVKATKGNPGDRATGSVATEDLPELLSGRRQDADQRRQGGGSRCT